MVNLVCTKWREAASILLEEKVIVMASEDISSALITFIDSVIQFKHWMFKNVDLKVNGSFESMWMRFADCIKTLMLIDIDLTEKDLILLLEACYNLESLGLAGFSHIFMTGTFLENSSDLNLLKKSLKNVSSLKLSCSRYLTDSIFSRIISVVGPLRELCLTGCQICYQTSIWKRFYPSDGRVKDSEHVLTYHHVLQFIQKNQSTLKHVSLSRTSIDSESLAKLSEVPGLNLKSLHLMACDQLTKGGIQVLTKNQKNLMDLDISLCSRVTDYAVLAIADNLPFLKSLKMRRCQSVTEVGLENLSRLEHLEKLDISHLDVKKWESIHEALGKVKRPMMVWLSVASLPIQWETVLALATTTPNLRHLDLSMCVLGVTDKSIQAVCRSMVKLEDLLLNGCSAVSDIGLSGHDLGNRPEAELETCVTQLSLETLGIRDRNPYKIPLGLKAEQAIRQEAEVKQYLKEHVEQIVFSSGHGLANLRGLKELNLCGCIRISDLTLRYAVCFTELAYLNLSHCQQTNEEGLIEVTLKCRALEVFLLADCCNASDKFILVLAHHLKRIKTLDFQRCALLTNDALDSLSCCRTLRYLDVSWCDKMTLEQVEVVRKRIPRLLDLHHRGIKPLASREEDHEELHWGNKNAPTPPPLLSKHKRWRSFVKVEKRRIKRRHLAQLRDDREKTCQAALLADPSYRAWIEEQELLAEEGLKLEEEAAKKRWDEWRARDLELHNQWLKNEEKKKILLAEKQRQEEKIKKEWEETVRKEEMEREKKKMEQEALLNEATSHFGEGESTHNPVIPLGYRNAFIERKLEACPFFVKTGACRFGKSCSREHEYPAVSRTILLPNMYSYLAVNSESTDDYDTDLNLEFSETDRYNHFRDFYLDVLPEFEKYGLITQFKVCCNKSPHLRGNVYVQYEDETSAANALRIFNARWYAGKQISCYLVLVERWKPAICGLYWSQRCPKGNNCNFLHVYRNPGNAFARADRDYVAHRRYDGSSTRSSYGSQRKSRSRSRGTKSPPRRRRSRRRDSRSRERDNKSRERKHRDRRKSRSRERGSSRNKHKERRTTRNNSEEKEILDNYKKEKKGKSKLKETEYEKKRHRKKYKEIKN